MPGDSLFLEPKVNVSYFDDNVSLILYVGSRMTGSHQIQKLARVGTRVTYVQPMLSTVETGYLKI